MKKAWILILVLAGIFLSTGTVMAKSKKEKKGKKEAVAEKPKAPKALLLLVKGHDAYILKEYSKALGFYKDAAEESPKSPIPHYFIGCAKRAMKDYDDAIDSFKTAYLMAGDDAWWKGLAAFNVAVTYEQAGKLAEAKSAWKDFKKFAVDKPALKKYVDSADSRIQAIEKYMELDKAYEIVRERIAKQ
jgi:tetratricopeptide (TPR) repeat protein